MKNNAFLKLNYTGRKFMCTRDIDLSGNGVIIFKKGNIYSEILMHSFGHIHNPNRSDKLLLIVDNMTLYGVKDDFEQVESIPADLYEILITQN